ncbi:MAG: hypothetical protein JO140_03195 [Candidatus Eremiobacteraeota bacterium]|nr:hypothetical protein [Candidatus Eremiobacteraeota bacterium]
MPPFRFGINYWPTKTAMAMWSHFDPSALDTDFARIAGAGLGSVRFFLLWEAFQPHEDRIDPEALLHLERFLELLGAHGLRGMPTLFCGHMSGVNWLPPWTLDVNTPHGRFRTISGGRISPYGIGDFYENRALLDAQRFAVRTLGERFRAHPAIEAWDLGNEFSNLREPRTPQQAAAWSATLARELADASGHPVTGGIHGEDLERDRHLRPSSICAPWTFATMHGYSVYSTFARGRTDTEVVPFLYELVASFSGKRVLFSEFGNPACPSSGPIACLDEDEMAAYATEVAQKLYDRGALGAYWWCYSDYDPRLRTTPPFDLAPHELAFGAWRADGTPKPVANALSELAARAREDRESPPPLVMEADYYRAPMRVREIYAAYVSARERTP